MRDKVSPQGDNLCHQRIKMGIPLCEGKHYSREGGWNLKQLILPLIIEKELNMGSDVDAYGTDI